MGFVTRICMNPRDIELDHLSEALRVISARQIEPGVRNDAPDRRQENWVFNSPFVICWLNDQNLRMGFHPA